MGARSGQKIKLLYLCDIFKKYTDEEHPLSAGELCEKLAALGVTAERKAIYNDIEVLNQYGLDIVNTRMPKNGYFLGNRDFELPEIYLLQDAVRSAKFISSKKTRELLAKLDTMLSVYQAKKREKNIFYSDTKCTNEEIYYVIDAIGEAIDAGKKIKFRYDTRTFSQNREIGIKSKERKISPYAMTWQDDHYYLIGNYEKYDNLMHLRIDRMHKIEITDEKSRHFSEVSDYTAGFDVSDYTNRLFSMYGGEFEEISLRCDKKLTEQVVDRFSERIFVRDVSETHFSFTVKAAVSEGLVGWILSYGTSIEVVSPKSLRERVKLRAKEIFDVYNG